MLAVMENWRCYAVARAACAGDLGPSHLAEGEEIEAARWNALHWALADLFLQHLADPALCAAWSAYVSTRRRLRAWHLIAVLLTDPHPEMYAEWAAWFALHEALGRAFPQETDAASLTFGQPRPTVALAIRADERAHNTPPPSRWDRLVEVAGRPIPWAAITRPFRAVGRPRAWHVAVGIPAGLALDGRWFTAPTWIAAFRQAASGLGCLLSANALYACMGLSMVACVCRFLYLSRSFVRDL